MLLHRRRRPPGSATATSGLWAASTTSSTSAATVSAPCRDRVRPCRPHTRSPKPPSSAARDDLKGQAIAAFVTLESSYTDAANSPESLEALKAGAQVTGSPKRSAALARPDDLRFTQDAPQNALRQNHAPPPARVSHQRRNQRRHHHPRRLPSNSQTPRIRRGLAGQATAPTGAEDRRSCCRCLRFGCCFCLFACHPSRSGGSAFAFVVVVAPALAYAFLAVILRAAEDLLLLLWLSLLRPLPMHF